jgi:hypothetical protein
MDDRQVALITGIYVVLVLFVALVALIGGPDIEEYIADWSGFFLSDERASWETDM